MRLAVLAVAAVLLVPASARADSIAFERDGNVWLMAGDGSDQRQVTSGRAFEWPSEADDGTLVAQSGDDLYRLDQHGTTLSTIPTGSTETSEDFPIEQATHVRISPDGTKIAYDQAMDDEVATLWTDAAATTVDYPNQMLGQEGLGSPSWIGNGTLLVSRDETADPDDTTMFARYTVGDGDDSAVDWFNDPGGDWATGLDAAASRDGSHVAVLEDDAADNDGTPTRVALRLFSSAAFVCEIAVPPSDDWYMASPTFSPDGRQVAWAQDDGIHVANADCSGQRTLTTAGAWEPYWSPADDAQPMVGTPGGGTARLTLKLTHARLGARLRVSVSASEPATVRLTLRHNGRPVAATARKLAAGTTIVHLRLSARTLRAAKKFVLRATAAGAAPASVILRR